MKKLSYIIFGLLFWAVSSCQKEAIAPVSERNASDVIWRSADTRDSGDAFSDKKSTVEDKGVDSNGTGESGSGFSGETGDSGGGITDPNNDPDSTRKKGKK